MDIEDNAISPSETAFAVIWSIICAFGLVGNAIVIFIVLVTKEYKKSTTNWFVVQLALADTLFLITIPLKVSDKANGSWMHSTEACVANQGILFITYYASVMFLMVMSIDRYIAVCHSFSTRLQKLRKPTASYIVTCIVWTVAILISIPVLIHATKRGFIDCFCEIRFSSLSEEREICDNEFNQFPNLNFDCDPRRCVSQEDFQQISDYYDSFNSTEEGSSPINSSLADATTAIAATTSNTESQDFVWTTAASVLNAAYSDSISMYDESEHSAEGETGSVVEDGCIKVNEPPVAKAHVWVNFTVMFLLPILVMSVCYGLITVRFRQTIVHQTAVSVKRSQKTTAGDRDRRRVTIMCIILVAVFFVCWLLFHIVEITRLTSHFGLTSVGCEILVDTSFVFIYLNSALNPYLYSFLGTGFARKWQALKASGLGKQLAAATTRNGGFSMTVRSKHISQRGTKTSPLKQPGSTSNVQATKHSTSSNKLVSESNLEEKKSQE